jgi:Immunity protein Imm1
VNPSRESLRELVLNGGDDFWAAGSGQAALELNGAEGGRLLLMGLEAEGFLLIYEPATGHDFCSVNPSDTAREQHDVEVHVGGEPMQVPRRHFLDKETAWRVIDDFLHDGRRSPRLQWEPWL